MNDYVVYAEQLPQKFKQMAQHDTTKYIESEESQWVPNLDDYAKPNMTLLLNAPCASGKSTKLKEFISLKIMAREAEGLVALVMGETRPPPLKVLMLSSRLTERVEKPPWGTPPSSATSWQF